jgi:hypothetical protein
MRSLSEVFLIVGEEMQVNPVLYDDPELRIEFREGFAPLGPIDLRKLGEPNNLFGR